MSGPCAQAQAAAATSVTGTAACAPAPQVSDSGPFSWPTLVFFAPHSSQLTQRARLVLDAFKQKVVTFKVDGVGLEAHTDGAA